MGSILNENMANYISSERLTNVDFGKKCMAGFFFNSASENCKNDCESQSEYRKILTLLMIDHCAVILPVRLYLIPCYPLGFDTRVFAIFFCLIEETGNSFFSEIYIR